MTAYLCKHHFFVDKAITVVTVYVYIKYVRAVWGISENWQLKNILIFAVSNSKYDSKIQLTMAICKNARHMSEICAKERRMT